MTLKCFSWVEMGFLLGGRGGVFLGILGGVVRSGSPNSHIMGLFLIQLEPIDKYVQTPP